MLKKLNELVDATPPMQQQQRFGNYAFKTWHSKLLEVLFYFRNPFHFLC
jgi:hypothetical protein